jgi:predicted esterase
MNKFLNVLFRIFFATMLALIFAISFSTSGCTTQPNDKQLDAQVDVNVTKLSATASSPTKPAAPVSFQKEVVLTTNSGTTNWVFVPSTYDSTHETPMKLFVWLHGCGGRAQYDVYNVSPGGSQNWISLAVGGREGSCWSNAATDGKKILTAIADLRTHFNIDPQQIYLGGYSSGGDIGYVLAFQNSNLFAGLLFENTGPSAEALTLAKSVTKKMPIAHLSHVSDTTYPIATIRSKMATLKSLGFSVTLLERPGTHWDNDTATSGTVYDLRKLILPYLSNGFAAAPIPTPSIVLNVSVVKTYEWGSGYCQQYYFENKNSVPVTWKQFKVDLKDGRLRGTGSTWNGVFADQKASGVITVLPVDWVKTVSASTKIAGPGFCVDYGVSKQVSAVVELTY